MAGSEGHAAPGRAAPSCAAPEQIILSVAVAAPLLGVVTHPLLCAGAGIAVATLLTLRHIAADVRALRVWAGE